MENIVQSLKIKCVKAGTNLTEVCRLAGVDRSTLSRWQKEEPNTIRILRRIEQAIEQKAKERKQ